MPNLLIECIHNNVIFFLSVVRVSILLNLCMYICIFIYVYTPVCIVFIYEIEKTLNIYKIDQVNDACLTRNLLTN